MNRNQIPILVAALLVSGACDQEQATAPAAVEPQLAKYGQVGFRTSQPAQALLVAAGELVPLATSGDVMPGSGERLVGIPDGIGSWGGARFMNSSSRPSVSDARVLAPSHRAAMLSPSRLSPSNLSAVRSACSACLA